MGVALEPMLALDASASRKGLAGEAVDG